MAGNLITSLLSLATNLLPSITASSSNPNHNSEKERARAVEEDLKKLMRTLERIKATMYDAEEREIRDRSVKLWLKELKKVAYDAEDVLNEYRYEVTRVQVEARRASQASGSYKRKQMEDIVPIPDGMVDRLNKIRSQFDEIAKDREALQLRESDGLRRPSNKILRTPTGHMVDEKCIYGRDAEIMEVINFLLSKKKHSFSVGSIVGKGGLGKTTIAQLVYKDGRVSQCFDLLGWVCVSEEFDVKRIIKATIESLCKINNDLSELSPLQEKLAKTVKGKRILLVLDDVWNENHSLWEMFQVSFKEAKLVRFLTTTRNNKVAEVMQTTTYFRPTNLPDDSCWQLFQHYAFNGTSDTLRTHFVNMGWEIMKKCGGLPLAVKSIASLLGHETNEEGWKDILESDMWQSSASDDIFPALQISYVHLPAHLKPCFLFCALYPRDYVLEKINLIELWISHGYIESKDKRKTTKIAVEYYEELKERSFLDDFSIPNLEQCKLHDIIHDLARLNSNNEHCSLEVNQPLDIQEGNVLRETYHLHVRGSMGYVNQIFHQNLMGLRTLSMDLRYCDNDLEHEYCIKNTMAMDLNLKVPESYKECSRDVLICNLSKFQAIRVLEFKGYGLTKIPDSVFELKNLAYLFITSASLKELPLSIGRLYNLKTLILDCFSLDYLPESIGNLANLHFLNIPFSQLKKLPDSLCSLSNLLRLVIGSDHFHEVPSDLKNLCNLHELTIRSNRIQALPDTIGSLRDLEELNLLPLGHSYEKKKPIDYVPRGDDYFPAIKTMAAWLRVKTIAWLRDMNCLEGKLSIGGLKNMSNLNDAKQANLKNKRKLETLELCWFPGSYPLPCYQKSNLILECELPETCEGGSNGADDIAFSLLEYLQPHPNLMKLRLKWYPSSTLPRWMSSLHSIQEILLFRCDNIQTLPFSNLHNLKCFTIDRCYSIQVLHLEELSSKLEELHILSCNCLKLITGLRNLKMLAVLEIFGANYSLLECLQPNHNLRKLQIRFYFSVRVPGWMRVPHSLQSIQEIWLERCTKIQSLPFKKLDTLKHLTIDKCYSIRVLKLQQLSTQLEELHILNCDRLELITGLGNLSTLKHLTIKKCRSMCVLKLQQLSSRLEELNLLNCKRLELITGLGNLPTLKYLTIRKCHSIRVLQLEQVSYQIKKLFISNCDCLELITGLGKMDKLDTLEIISCKALNSITMEELMLVESTEPSGDSSDKRPHIDQQSMSSLTSLVIHDCDLLCDLTEGLIPSGSCYVSVSGCGYSDIEL